MNFTENLNLKKPARTDYYNVEDFNENADILDKAVSENTNEIEKLRNVIFDEYIPIQASYGTGGSVEDSDGFRGVIGGKMIFKGTLKVKSQTAYPDPETDKIKTVYIVPAYFSENFRNYLNKMVVCGEENNIKQLGWIGSIQAGSICHAVYATYNGTQLSFTMNEYLSVDENIKWYYTFEILLDI